MRVLARATVLMVLLASCDQGPPDLPAEPWVERPVAEWPDFVLTNEVRFADTTYHALANAFLVDTGSDTVAVTVKHMFLVFERHQGLETIDLGPAFTDWRFLSSLDSDRVVRARRLVNADTAEPIGDFSSLKDRDWLLFEVERPIPEGVYPLKVRVEPIRSGETVYAVGRSAARRGEPVPSVRPLRRYQAVGTYYYVRPLDPDADAVETSGSAVIDAGGYLVGIVSGAVGELGVVAGVDYLIRLLDRHGIPYLEAGRPD